MEQIMQGYIAHSLHGRKFQAIRDRLMDCFRERQIRMLMAVVVSVRLDVKDIRVVVNMDFHESVIEVYVRRIGRIGRGVASGLAVAFVRPADVRPAHMPGLLVLQRRCDQEVPADIERMVHS